MKLFECQNCGQPLYFENTVCESCGHRLGYIPDMNTVSALEPEGDQWRALAASGSAIPVLPERGSGCLQLADPVRPYRDALRRLPP